MSEETKTWTDVLQIEDPEEAAQVYHDAGYNHYHWWGGPPEKDSMRQMMQQDFTRGYKRMAALMDLAYHDYKYSEEKGIDTPRSLGETLLWNAKFNAKLAELAKPHNEAILEREINESA